MRLYIVYKEIWLVKPPNIHPAADLDVIMCDSMTGMGGKEVDSVVDIEEEEQVTVDEKELEEQVNDLGRKIFRSFN